MNWPILLLVVMTITALANPVKSPNIDQNYFDLLPKELVTNEIFSRLPLAEYHRCKIVDKKRYEEIEAAELEELAFLDQIDNKPDPEDLLDARIISIILQGRSLKEVDVRQAVEATREMERAMFGFPEGQLLKEYLPEELKPILPHESTEELQALVDEAYSEALREERGKSEHFSKDTKCMDVAVARKLSSFPNLEDYLQDLHRAALMARAAAKANRLLFYQELMGCLEKDYSDTFYCWQWVQKGRRTMKKEIREGKEAMAKGTEDDQLLKTMLYSLKDQDAKDTEIIGEGIKYGRYTNSLQMAVKFKKVFALRRLLSKKMPKIIIVLANSNADIIRLLSQHWSLTSPLPLPM